MLKEEEDQQAYFKIAQLLATSDISSVISEKYAEHVLLTEGNMNYQIDASTVFRLIKLKNFGCTVLHIFYKKNQLNLFKLLLNYGADVSIKNQRGSTILHQIIEDTFKRETKSSVLTTVVDNPYLIPALDALVKSGNINNSCNKIGITHFHIACMANHKPALDMFLQGQVLINQFVANDSPIFPGYSTIHFAVKFSNLDLVTILLEYVHHEVVNKIKDAKGMTPLHILLQSNIEIADLLNKKKVVNAEQLITQRKTNEDIISLLLSKLPEQIIVVDDTHLSRLHIACIVESTQLTEDQLDKFKYLNQAVNDKSTVFSGNTPLHFAALCNVEKVKILLKKGANISLQNGKKETAFDLCLERYEVKDIHDIIATQPKWNNIEIPIIGKTILDVVSCLQTLDLSPLHSKTGQINACINRKSPLWPNYHLQHLAVIFSERGCKNDSMLIEKVIKDSKTSMDRFTKLPISPLHLAFRLKRLNVVKFLLLTCNNLNYINCVDSDKLSHLHIACAAGIADAVENLLLNGAEVNAQLQANFEWLDSELSREVYIPKGSTPLHVAVIVGNCEVIKVLLHNGADLYAKDDHEMTPIHWLLASDNPISPAADILLLGIRAISMKLSTGSNKRIAIKFNLKECITSNGFSHLHVASFANNVTAVQQLLEDEHPNVNGIFSCSLSDEKRFPGKFRYAGYTPLHLALERNNTKVVNLLIQRGAQVLMKNTKTNLIPLYEAFNNKSSPSSEILISFFKNNKVLQEQLKDAFGLTILHFYCYMLDYDAVETILSKGDVDLNKPILSDSPFWPGFTPLHVLMKFYQSSNQNADALLKLMLNYGASVTAMNAENNTPVHLAFELNIETSSKNDLLQLLLRQKKIVTNPTNSRGLSHFHIACALCNLFLIQRFLIRYDSVNHTVDYFYGDENLNGCTPLHLALYHPLNDDVHPMFKVKVVNLLIRSGALVNIANILGDTALHLAAKYYPNYITLLKRIVHTGGNIYAKNILGETPFEIILNSEDVSIPGVQYFLDREYSPNSFNPITQKGFLAILISSDSGCPFEQQRPVLEILMEVCGTVLDNTGRTIIHNIVSTSTPHVSGQAYNLIVELLAKNVNIDYQDNLGRTALHIATQFKNHLAVFALLQAGADVNMTDANEKTAFAYAFETSAFYEESQDNSELVVRIFSQYVQKLNVCQLDVHEMNHNALINALTNYNLDVNVSERFYNELDQMKKIRIKSTSVTFLNVISGTNNESKSLLISLLNPTALIDSAEKIDKERFYESLGIFRLQCRKYSKKLFSLA